MDQEWLWDITTCLWVVEVSILKLHISQSFPIINVIRAAILNHPSLLTTSTNTYNPQLRDLLHCCSSNHFHHIVRPLFWRGVPGDSHLVGLHGDTAVICFVIVWSCCVCPCASAPSMKGDWVLCSSLVEDERCGTIWLLAVLRSALSPVQPLLFLHLDLHDETSVCGGFVALDLCYQLNLVGDLCGDV